jgi:hypothetical protein
METEMTTGPIPPRLAAIIRSRLGLPALASGGPPQVDQSEPSEKQKTTHPVRSAKGNDEPAMPRPLITFHLLRPTLVGLRPLMSEPEIVRELRRLRYDSANGRGRGRKVPIKRIAEQAGVHRATLYRIIRDGRVSDNSRVALSLVL